MQASKKVAGADKLIDAQGQLTSEGTGKFLDKFMQAFSAWITSNTRA